MHPSNLVADGAEDQLPCSPIHGSDALVPLRTWAEVLEEHRFHGIDFDAFWYETLADGVCFYYRWAPAPRAIVLIIIDDGTLRHIECRKDGAVELSADESAPIVAEVTRAFALQGFRVRGLGPLH